MRLLRLACKSGVAGVVVTHDAQLASWADRSSSCATGGWSTAPAGSPVPSRSSAHDRDHPDSATSLDRRDSDRPDGGTVARRAVVRWAWRLFRREWRRQAQVLALLTLVVAATIAIATGTYNTSGVGDDAEFGTAAHLFRIDGIDAGRHEEAVSAAEEWFGEVGVVATWERPVPGSVERVQYRGQDPDGPFSAPMLAWCGGATRATPTRSRSPTESRRASGPRSATHSTSTAGSARWSAWSRTPATSPWSSPWSLRPTTRPWSR